MHITNKKQIGKKNMFDKFFNLALFTAMLMGCASINDNKSHGSVSKEFEVSTDQAKTSYATGYEQIKALTKESSGLDQEAYLLGMTHALENLAPNLTPSEIEQSIDWQWLADSAYQQAKHASQNAGETFLARNKGKSGIKTLPGGLQYKVLVEGQGNTKPSKLDTVTLGYRISRIDGKSRPIEKGKTKSITTTAFSQLIPGWQEALQLMTEGAEWQLFIPSHLAFGEKGLSIKEIIPNETLVCDIELISINQNKTITSKKSQSLH